MAKYLENNMEKMNSIYLKLCPKIIILVKNIKNIPDNIEEKLKDLKDINNLLVLTNEIGYSYFIDILYLRGMRESFKNEWIQNSLYKIANIHFQIINNL